jgi:chromosome segregation ATPase
MKMNSIDNNSNKHNDSIEYKSEIQDKSVNKEKEKNIFYDKNIETIQNSIQRISKKIEVDKINLRILQERYTKKLSEYNQLAGKPVIKTKDQKMEEMKQKMEKLKNHQIFDPKYGKKTPVLQPDEETRRIQKNSDKRKIELDNLIDSINKQVEYNARLTHEIEEVRKEKARINEKIEKAEEENKKIEEEFEKLQKKNNRIYNKIQFKELNKVKEKGKDLENQFLEKRDYLEDKFHKVIEENIRREKDHRSDLKKIRLKNALFADKARNKVGNKSMVNKVINIEDPEEMHDRMPILDYLIDKWKYMTKYKRNMLDKYIRYANEIRISFDKLLNYLGLESLDKLPEIYTKNEKQMSEIESYLSCLSTEVDSLNEQKSLLKRQIVILTQTKEYDKEEKSNLIEERKAKIQILKRNNDELEQNINRKKRIFKNLEKPTFDFLKKMQKTYLTDFVVNRNNVEEKSKLNENNVINFLGTVYCYCQLIKDFDENVKYNNQTTKTQESEANRTLDFLNKDIRFKLSKINKNICNNDNINNSINNVIKKGNDFDETIKRLANVIVDQVNNNGEQSLNNISILNTNNISS